MNSDTTTKFKGDIVFNDGEKDILVSDLATVDEVNEALGNCVNVSKIDKSTSIFISDPSGLVLDTTFVYDDDHVLSSKAAKELIQNTASSIPDVSDYRKFDDMSYYVDLQITSRNVGSNTGYSFTPYFSDKPVYMTLEFSDGTIYKCKFTPNGNGGLTHTPTDLVVDNNAITNDIICSSAVTRTSITGGAALFPKILKASYIENNVIAVKNDIPSVPPLDTLNRFFIDESIFDMPEGTYSYIDTAVYDDSHTISSRTVQELMLQCRNNLLTKISALEARIAALENKETNES